MGIIRSAYVLRWGMALVVSMLVACASTEEDLPATPDYEELMSLAEASVASGATAAAIQSYELAAQVAPDRKQPWQSLALLYSRAGRPVSALAAAERTLQRDPADAIANQVFIDSGTLVYRQTLQRLRGSGAKVGSDAHRQTREIVGVMGQVFGDETLVPDSVKARLAKRAAQECRALRARAPVLVEPPRQPDPLEVLGGD